MAYEVELSQIGRSGTVVVETDFKLAFTLDLYREPRVVGEGRYRRVVGKRTPRVFELLSPCHQARYEQRKRSELGHCYVCGEPSRLAYKELTFSLSPSRDEATKQLQEITDLFEEDFLTSMVLAVSILTLSEEIFIKIQQGERVRELLTIMPKAEL